MLLIVAQVVGITAVALYLISFQLKRRKHIVWVTCLSNALYVLQYILLGAFSGALLDTISTVSSFFAGKKHTPGFQRYVKTATVATILLIFGAGSVLAVLRHSWLELLPVVGSLFQTGGLWFNDEQRIRRFALIGAPFWLIYNFLSMAYGAALGSLLMMISAIVALVRYSLQ